MPATTTEKNPAEGSTQTSPPPARSGKASAKTAPQPAVGRQVHYVLGDKSPNKGEHRAATICLVHTDNKDPVAFPGLVNLNVALGKPTDPANKKAGETVSPNFFAPGVTYDAACKPGTWHWPEGSPDASRAAEAEAQSD